MCTIPAISTYTCILALLCFSCVSISLLFTGVVQLPFIFKKLKNSKNH